MNAVIVSKKFVKKWLPIRARNSNKSDGGKLLVIGGSRGMWGAGILSALAGTRSGAGYTYLMSNWNFKQILNNPDFLYLDFKTAHISNKKFTAIVFGPGIGVTATSKKMLSFLIKAKVKNLVLDADGLNLLSVRKPTRLPSSWILTPHEGELARLLNTSAEHVRRHPIRYLQMAHKKWNCVVLLKGARTYIYDGRDLLVCRHGTPALAKAGTGDVLSGIIGGFLSQGIPPLKAAAMGAFVHGHSSRLWLRKKNDVISLRPLDLVEILPRAIQSFR